MSKFGFVNDAINQRYSSLSETSCCLSCGGGSAFLAKNKNGQMNTTDCRPIKMLLSLVRDII